MGFHFSELIMHLLYAYLGYSTFKSIRIPPNEATEKSEHKKKKLLLKWVSCTILLYFQGALDYFVSWVPTYYFWKTILMALILVENSLAVKLLQNFEQHIQEVENYIDNAQNSVYRRLSFLTFPFFKATLKSLKFVIEGASSEQLQELEKLITSFKTITKKEEDDDKFDKTELKKYQTFNRRIDEDEKFDKIDMKKFQTNRKVEEDEKFDKNELKKYQTLPSPAHKKIPPPAKTPWKANVHFMLKKGSSSYFPHTIWFDAKNKLLHWKAEGDDVTFNDTFVGVKVKDEKKYLLEIKLATSAKMVKFVDLKSMNNWEAFLQGQV